MRVKILTLPSTSYILNNNFAISVNDDYLICSCFKIILILRITEQQISVAKKLSFAHKSMIIRVTKVVLDRDLAKYYSGIWPFCLLFRRDLFCGMGDVF